MNNKRLSELRYKGHITDGEYKELKLAIKALEDVKGLRLLVDWAVECDFGYDNIPEEYEKYKEEIADMNYTEGLIYIAKRVAENVF